MNQKQQGHGYFRKSKAYGLVCGIALAGTLMLSQGVKADEVVEVTPEVTITANPATNLPEAQPEAPADNVSLASEAGTQTGELVSEVTSDKLDNAVSTATEAGVTVTTENKVVYDSLDKAQADLAKQETAVKEATAKQEANTEAIETAVAENKAIDKANADEKARIDALNKQGEADVKARNEAGQKAVDERNEAGQKAVDTRNAQAQREADETNARLKEEYDAKVAEREAIVSENEAIRKRNEAKQAEADSQNAALLAEYNRKKAEMEAKTKETGNLSEVLDQNLINASEHGATVHLVSVNQDQPDKSLFFTNEDYWREREAKFNIKAGEVVYLEKGASATFEYTGLTNTFYGTQPIVKMVRTLTSQTDSPMSVAVMNDPTDGWWAAIDYVEGEKAGSGVARIVEDTSYYLADGTKVVLDGGALLSLSSLNYESPTSNENAEVANGRVVAITGSSVKANGNKTVSSYNHNAGENGNIYSTDTWDHDGSGLEYYGSAVAKIDSGVDSVRVTSVSVGRLNVWFKTNTDLKVPSLPIIPRPAKVNVEPEKPVPPTPVEPNYVTPKKETFTPEGFTPEKYNPLKPKVTPHVDVPEKELFKVSVHPVEIKQKPTNVKDVKNEDNVSINGMLVPKGHLVQWELSNSPLKAGRDETTSYTLVDALPSGFELDEKASVEANPAWIIGKTEAGTTTLVATKATLDMLNADLTKDVAIPGFKAIGRPLNDGGTYENTFKTIIGTPKGEYTTTSNTPVIYTPGDDSRTYNGQVIVRYRTEEGDIEIRKNVIDTEDGKVGSDYDTTDNRPDTIAYEGKLYTRTPKVVGDETGKVVRGKIYVTYYYKEVPSTPDTGSVIVHYINEEGTPIKNDVVDTPEAPVGEDYDTTDNKPKRIVTTDGIEYEIIPKRTIGNETGKVTGGVTEVTYVYKRITPKPPTPTPNDNLIQPKKDVVDNKGVSINGKVVLPNTPINYVLTQDFDQYEGMVASEKAIADGFIYIEDYQDDALDGKSMVVKSIKAKNGDDVAALYEMRHVLSKDELTGRLAEIVGKSGVVPTGEFYVWYAKDPAAFFKNYVQKGLSVTYDVTFKIKEGFTGKFTNQTHQIDFGNGYYGNIVENEVPELKVNKDIKKDGELVDKAEVAIGETFDYVLNGYKVEANRGYDIENYAFVDLLTLSHDQVIKTDLKTSVDVTLSDGSVIKAGESIAKFGGVSFDEQTGRYEFSLSSDFLAKVPRESAFGADLIITVKRIKSGTVENKFDFYLNGIPVISDTVITETPEPPTPPTPEVPEEPKKPEPPTPPAPQVPEKPVLPKTGDAGSVLALVGSVLSGLGIVGLKRKKD